MARMYNPPHPGEVFREFLPDGMTSRGTVECGYACNYGEARHVRNH